MWFRQRSGKATNRCGSKPLRTRLARRREFLAQVEALEDRRMLASSITIVPGASGTGTQDANLLADGQILFADPDVGGNTLSSGALASIAAATNITVQSTGTITFNDLGGTLTLQTGAGNTASFSTDIAGGGAITFATTNTLVTSGGNLEFSARSVFTLDASIQSSAGNITLTADDMAISATSAVNAGTGVVTLQQATTTRQIDLGLDTPDMLGLTDVELDRVTASLLRIGRTDAMGVGGQNVSLRLSGLITGSASYNNTLSLRAGSGNIRTFGGGTLTVTNLAAVANDVGLRGNVTNLVGLATSTGLGSGFFFDSNANLSVSGTPIDGVVGVTAMGNTQIFLAGSTAGTALTVSGPLTTGTGTFADVLLRFDNMTINAAISAGTSASPGQRVTLIPQTGGQAIALGGADAVGTLGLTDAELDLITTGVVDIGSFFQTLANISVAGQITAPAGYNTLSLQTGGAIVDATATEQADVTVANLALQSGNNLGGADDLDIAVTNLALLNAVAAVQITNSGPLTIGTVDGIVGSTNTGTTTTITANALVIAANVSDSADVVLTALDSAGTGDNLTVNAGVTVESGAFDVFLQAGDDLNLLAGSTVSAGGFISTFVDAGNLDAGVGGVAHINGMLDASSMFVNGAGDSDTFNITPDDDTQIFVDGNAPIPPASPGDVLNVNLAGTTGTTLTSMSTATGLDGEWSFTNRATVDFTEIETLSQTTISISADVTVAEGNSGTTNAVFSVTLGSATNTDVTVVVSTADGTATSAGAPGSLGNDYEDLLTTLTFAPGQTSKQVTVSVNGDFAFEGNENFLVNLSAAVNAVVLDAQAQATITNDDAQPTLTISSPTVLESAGHAVFNVLLQSPSTQTVTVQFATAPGSASAGSDYQSTSGTLTFMPGQTTQLVSVPIVNDTLTEPDEQFFVNLSAQLTQGSSRTVKDRASSRVTIFPLSPSAPMPAADHTCASSTAMARSSSASSPLIQTSQGACAWPWEMSTTMARPTSSRPPARGVGHTCASSTASPEINFPASSATSLLITSISAAACLWPRPILTTMALPIF